MIDTLLEKIAASSKVAFLERNILLVFIAIDNNNIFQGQAIFGFNFATWPLKSDKLLLVNVES